MNPLYPWTEGAWRQLHARLESLPQALLIHGPRGIGKLDLARRFAQRVLCETPATIQPCGACEGCHWFQAGQHPDYRQVEPESMAAVVEYPDEPPRSAKTAKPSREIKVDQIRELTDFLNIGSHRAKRRLVLFHPAEDLNQNAANSLLKALEESSTNVCLILVSNNYARLLPTLLSRCIRFPVEIPAANQSRAWLAEAQVAQAEHWLAFSGGAPLLARDFAVSDQAEAVSQLLKMLVQGNREGLLAWPATDREQVELMAEVLQKWAYDQVFGSISGEGRFFGKSVAKRSGERRQRHLWLRFARQAGRYRVEARHPLNPKLFLADLIAAMPES